MSASPWLEAWCRHGCRLQEIVAYSDQRSIRRALIPAVEVSVTLACGHKGKHILPESSLRLIDHNIALKRRGVTV